MKKYEWKIELLNQIPLIAATCYGLFSGLFGYIVLFLLLCFAELTGIETIPARWTAALVVTVIGLLLLLISLCFLRWWKPWLVGSPVQLAVYGVVWHFEYFGPKWKGFAIIAGCILLCQAIALLIKTLIRRRKAKKVQALEGEVIEQ